MHPPASSFCSMKHTLVDYSLVLHIERFWSYTSINLLWLTFLLSKSLFLLTLPIKESLHHFNQLSVLEIGPKVVIWHFLQRTHATGMANIDA